MSEDSQQSPREALIESVALLYRYAGDDLAKAREGLIRSCQGLDLQGSVQVLQEDLTSLVQEMFGMELGQVIDRMSMPGKLPLELECQKLLDLGSILIVIYEKDLAREYESLLKD